MVTVRELANADVEALAVCPEGVVLRTVEGELRKVDCEWRTVELQSERIVVDVYGSFEAPFRPAWIVWTAHAVALA